MVVMGLVWLLLQLGRKVGEDPKGTQVGDLDHEQNQDHLWPPSMSHDTILCLQLLSCSRRESPLQSWGPARYLFRLFRCSQRTQELAAALAEQVSVSEGSLHSELAGREGQGS